MATAADLGTPPVCHSAWLPPSLLLRILTPHAGDVATLCAAACVARAWRDAAFTPRLWADMCMSPRVASRLTDARLAMLTARAGDSLLYLDLSRGRSSLTARGVLRALREHRLASLRVRGVRSSGGELALDEVKDADSASPLALFRSLLLSGGSLDLDVAATCTLRPISPLDAKPCGRLCASQDVSCPDCSTYVCVACKLKHKRWRPRCTHLCYECLAYSEDDDHFWCEMCRRAFCGDCQPLLECCACEFVCCHACAELYSVSCSRRGCRTSYCLSCAEDGFLQSCGDCGNAYCQNCARFSFYWRSLIVCPQRQQRSKACKRCFKYAGSGYQGTRCCIS